MKNTTELLRLKLPDGNKCVIKLRLFVAGASPNSMRAISNMTSFCENYLKESYTLEIIDVHQQPYLAENEQIIALPLMIRSSPIPERRLIGDMSDIEKVIKGLGLVRISE